MSKNRSPLYTIHHHFRTGVLFDQHSIRTTNLIERAFAEQRRCTKIIPRFWDEQSWSYTQHKTVQQWLNMVWKKFRFQHIIYTKYLITAC